LKTLEYIEKLSGKELITKMAKNGEEVTIRQETEDYLNITTQRAFPKSQVAILLQESLPFPLIFDTQTIPVAHEFDWDTINNKKISINLLVLKKDFSAIKDKKLDTQDSKDDDMVEEFDI
jgi:hypothetical protein